MKKLILILSILIAMVTYAKADNFVTDVMVIGGTQAETDALKTQYQDQGWTVVNQNLNQGAGGDYIYLLYKTDSDANPNATFITYFASNTVYQSEMYLAPGITYYPVAYAGGSQFTGNLNSGTSGIGLYLYYTKESNGGTDNPHLVKSITFNSNSEGAMPEVDLNWYCGGNAPEIYMHPDITQGWIFWQGSPTECIISAYDGPKAWITSYTVPAKHDGLYVIAADVFDGFINLETLYFWYDSHVTDMPSMQGCTNFKHVNVRLNNSVHQDNTPPSMTSIPDNAFIGTAIEELTMPSVTQVGDYAFEGCNLSSVTFNQSNVQIGNGAFANISGNCTVTYSGSMNDWSPNAYVYSPNLVINASDGSCGWCGGADATSENNLYWTLTNATGHLNIDWLWPGATEQQVISSHRWNKNNVHSLTLNHVYAIGLEEFKDYTSLTSVSIGNGVTSIGISAFKGCSNLTSVTIGNGVTSIGNNAFNRCTGLTSVTINSNAILSRNYSSSSSLKAVFGNQVTSYTIGNDVTSIGNKAFEGCTGLTFVTLPNSVSSIGNNAFYGCTGLTSITIPNSVTSIRDYTFCYCTGLTSVTIPNSVTSIGKEAFFGCWGLTSVTIPNSVTSIGSKAFYHCTGLTSVTIPNSVTSIGSSAFEDCTGLTSVTIPNSVTSIGENAFIKCSSLTLITVESGNPIYDSRNNCNAIIETASNALILGCKNTVIPNSVTSIGNSAFEKCTGLTSVTIPNSVTSIGNSTFYGCTGLTSVTIPNSVTSIGNSAFYGCTGLTSVTISNSVTSIGDNAFNNCRWLTSVTLPNSVTSIGSDAFSGCIGLTSVTIPNSVTSIGSGAFNDCTGLTSVTIPNSVTSIENYTFKSCTGLTSVTIPNNVTSIGDLAFYYCSSLKDLYFDGTEAQWNNVSKGTDWNAYVASDYKEHWRCTVTITFNANGHGTAPAPQTNQWSNEKATRPTDPTESGYVFTGWYTDAQCTTPWNFGTDIVLGDMTLYAGWDLEVEGLQGSGTAEDPYLISNNGEWIWFAQSVTNGTTYAGQTVKLAANIAATVMAGSHTSETDYHAFSGTFDGNGHTITLALSGSGHGTALFYHLGDATLKNLKVQGSVTTIGYRPATFASIINGNSTISNCWSTVAVSSTRANDWVDGGGFVGRVSSNATLNMIDCAFHGSVTFTPSATTGGGMVGYTQSNATVNLTNCLYSPSALTLNVSQYHPRVFVSGYESGNLTNCYYTAVAAWSVLENQGTDAYWLSNEELLAALGPNWTITNGLVVPKWILTFTKAIAGYGTGNGGWQLIASPVGTVNLTDVPQLFDNQYDLYYFDQTGGDDGKEWKNHKAHTDTFTAFASGQGYLYANSGDVTLMFTGVPYDGNGEVTLTKADGYEFSGWNLVGNPYPMAATLDKPFYRMNESGTALSAQVEANNSVAAMEGVFVQASTNNEKATFTPQQSPAKGGRNTVPILNIDLARNRGEAIDNAIVRFDGGQTLGKYMLHKDESKIYIQQDGEDYAIVSVGRDAPWHVSTNEMPLNFKASENGTYTLTVNDEGLELDYLHLIDNLTGADVDLLVHSAPEPVEGPNASGAGPSTGSGTSYTFTAKTTDYESRFKLVFASSICGDANGDNETFAFVSNGNIIVNGEGVLQVVDMMGRIILCRDAARHVSTSEMTPGVYVLRLIDKEKVRTQKIVVE